MARAVIARDVMAEALDVMDRPWEWGAADCCTAACDVFARLHGIDPMAPLRGSYTTAFGAARWQARFGGFLPMAEALAMRAGLRDGSAGRAGDIGLSATGPDGTQGLVICAAPGIWAGKTLAGLGIVTNVVGVWRA